METDDPKNEIRDLSSAQIRVIGALMEKAFTTPDQYPLTLKALTSACNQKSNRDPVTNYDEGSVEATLDELREMSLIAEVYTDGGRAPRYRHYMRYRYDFTETQFAIMAELMLRGGQQPGELRTRASRMKRVESQGDLRSDLSALQEMGFVNASGPLDRRGVTVDHTFYRGKRSAAPQGQSDEQPAPIEEAAPVSNSVSQDGMQELREEIAKQRIELDELKLAVERLEDLMR